MDGHTEDVTFDLKKSESKNEIWEGASHAEGTASIKALSHECIIKKASA